MNLNLPILVNEQSSLPQFINFWSEFYEYPGDELYEKVNLPQLSAQDIFDLYEWKDGMPLGGGERSSLEQNVIPKLELVNRLKGETKIDLHLFNNEFASLSFVGRIFLLHIIKPQVYPIYDQNVHRCFNFIHALNHDAISNMIPDEEKELFYFNDYLPFISGLNGIPLRKIDRAFFTFGQFLNTRNLERLLD